MEMRFMLFGLSIGLFSCTSKTEKIKDFIPGTFVRFSENEMGRRHDTLEIEPLSEAGNNYHIIRRSSVQRQLDGKVFPWEQKKDRWIAIYDQGKFVLTESRKGKLISFAPERDVLLMGTAEYKKVK